MKSIEKTFRGGGHSKLVSIFLTIQKAKIPDNFSRWYSGNDACERKLLSDCISYFLPFKKVAITLAEVLITLVIVGAVIAITMPILITSIQDRQYITKWKREYAIITNAFQATLEEGIPVCSLYDSYGGCNTMGEEFRNSMMEKLAVVDYCSSEYSASLAQKYKWASIGSIRSKYRAYGSKEYGIDHYNFGAQIYLLNDGTAIYFGGSHGGPWLVVDVNNLMQGPNEFGRDVFIIKAYSNNKSNIHWLRPVGARDTYNKVGNGEICECSKDKGRKISSWLANPAGGGNGEYISGACCSAYYLYNK